MSNEDPTDIAYLETAYSLFTVRHISQTGEHSRIDSLNSFSVYGNLRRSAALQNFPYYR